MSLWGFSLVGSITRMLVGGSSSSSIVLNTGLEYTDLTMETSGRRVL